MSWSAQNESTVLSNDVGSRNTANWLARSLVTDFNRYHPPAALRANRKYFLGLGTVVVPRIAPITARLTGDQSCLDSAKQQDCIPPRVLRARQNASPAQ